MMKNRLFHRVCIITGAANGLGAAIAQGLAREGARVLIADIDADGLSRVQQACGPQAARVIADISTEEGAASIVRAAIENFGQLDIVVNNAGIGPGVMRKNFITQPIATTEANPAAWRRIIEVNLIGTFLVTHFALPHLQKRNWGRIINLSTTWETMLRPGFASYGASKAGIEAMSAALAAELAGTGVTVNTLIPGGPADTAQVPDDLGIDRSKLLRPEVLVPPVVWLAGEEADAVSSRRFSASHWDPQRSAAENLAGASEPVAWPQLLRPMVMVERGNLK